MVSVWVSVEGDQGAEAVELRRWLRDDASAFTVEPAEARIAPDEMGALSDLFLVVFSVGLEVTLVESIALWLRERKPAVRVRIKGPSGQQISIDADSATDAASVIAALDLEED